jgi:putative transposase
VRKALRHAWRWRRAEQRIRNLARRLDKEWPGIAATILEGIDEILCILPRELRRSPACTNIIENMNGTIQQVTRIVKRWQNGSMASRWTTAGMMEAKNGFRRLMAYKQLPMLKATRWLIKRHAWHIRHQ